MVVKVLWPEEHSGIADRLFERHGRRLAAPDLLRYEVANVIRHTDRLKPAERPVALANFQALPLRYVPLDDMALGEALHLALEREVTVYDASYAVLANRMGASLITADERFVRRMRDPKVVPLSEDPPEDA